MRNTIQVIQWSAYRIDIFDKTDNPQFPPKPGQPAPVWTPPEGEVLSDSPAPTPQDDLFIPPEEIKNPEEIPESESLVPPPQDPEAKNPLPSGRTIGPRVYSPFSEKNPVWNPAAFPSNGVEKQTPFAPKNVYLQYHPLRDGQHVSIDEFYS